MKHFSRTLTQVLLGLALLAASVLAQAQSEPPPEVKAVQQKVTDMAAHYAKQLDGFFGDRHAELMASGEGSSSPLYQQLKLVLDGFRQESGALYIYCLIDQDPADDHFEITVDGSAEPDDWLNPYETESQFVAALAGTPTPAPSAWNDDEDGLKPVWSAFAPIHNSQGQIVAILGVDYPAPQILKFPKWNRDSPEFSENP